MRVRCRPITFFTAALLATGVAPARAQDAAATPLSLDEVVRAVIARHPDLAAAEAAVSAARARPDIERQLMPPTVEVQAWEWPIDQWNPRYAQWMAMLTQEFPGKGKRDLRAARAEAEVAVMAGEVPAKRREIAAEAARTYVDLRQAREEIATIAAARDVIRQGVDAAEVRYATSQGAQADVLAGIVDLARLQQEDVMARERERMAASRLNLLRGLPPDTPVGLLAPAAEEAAIPTLEGTLASLVDEHPDTRLVDARSALAEKEVAVARAERRPDFLVQGGYMVMPFMTDAVTARVGITWPNAPWAKKRASAMTTAAEASVAAASAGREAVALRLRLMAQEAIVRASAAAERARLIETTVLPRATHALEVALIAYETTRGELMPVIDAQRMLVEARLEIRRALGDRDRTLAELRALGGGFDQSRQ
jgi:outer membrane protein TolC